MKYAIFDEQGFPKAFYDKEIHGDKIPSEAIEITEEQWHEFNNNQGFRKWDFENKQVVVYEPPQPTLEELKVIVNNQRKSKVLSLLQSTDYVITKLQEAQIDSDIDLYNTLLQQYQTELSQRKDIRTWNNTIEQSIANATTIEELEQIRQEISNYTGGSNL